MDSNYRPPLSDDCPTVDLLQAFYQGELTTSKIESITQHVERCERCASMLADWSAANGGAEADRIETVPDTVSYEYQPGEPERIGRYRVLQMIGRGGFGKVLLAQDEALDRLVAVKVPHPERINSPGDLESYHREARLHAAVDHPHIVPIYDVGATETTPFFAVSKFVPGMNLAERLQRRRPDYRTAAAWIATLADALQHVHDQKLVHRDIKPRNVMIDARGQPFLMDFGLAKVQVDRHGGHTLIVGTPAYMSPEQARGDAAALDHRTDIFSLGVVFYELLTGRKPFRGGTTPVLDQIQSVEPPLPRQCNAGIPRDLQAICLKALVKDPACRYQRAADLAEDLRCWLAREPLRHARRVGRLERAGLWIRRRPLAATTGGAMLICLSAAGLAFFGAAPAGPTMKVAVKTLPPGADLHFVPFDPKTGLLEPRLGKRGKAGVPLSVTPGYYLVVAVLDKRFHEVFRYVPQKLDEQHNAYRHRDFTAIDGVAHVQRIEIPDADAAKGMCLIPRAEAFSMGAADDPTYPEHRLRVPKYYLDAREVTVDEFLRVRPRFRFPTNGPVPEGIKPMTGINWDDAAAFAESVGKRLPDEAEYEYAATDLGRRQSSRRQAIEGWPFEPSGQPDTDCVTLEGQPPVFGLCTNVAEWTSSWYRLYPGQAKSGPPMADPMIRIVRGGPRSVIMGQPDDQASKWRPYQRVALPVPAAHPGLGFRCARSYQPRLQREDFILPLK